MPRRHVGTLRRTRLLRQLRSARDRPVDLDRGTARLRQDEPPRPVGDRRSAAGRLADGRPTATTTRSSSSMISRWRSTASSRSARSCSAAIASATMSHRTVVGRLLAAMSRSPERAPDRHRRRAPDHLTGVPRHPCGVGRAPARRVAGGHRGTRPAAASVRALARRRFSARDRSAGAGDGRARGRRAGPRTRAAAAGRSRNAPDAGDRGVAGSAGAGDARSQWTIQGDRSTRAPTTSSTTTCDPRCSSAAPRPRSRS